MRVDANRMSASTEAAMMRAGVAVLLAMAAHAVGIGVVFVAPRGQRLLPALLNGISLAIQIALIVAGWKLGGDVV
jgi:hypothetical protein